MTSSEKSAIDAIERDRKRKEEELLLLWLLIFGTAGRYASSAIRIGHDHHDAIRSVIIGESRLGLPGMIDPTARILAAAHEQGERRTWLLADEQPPFERGSVADAVFPVYHETAVRYATGMAATMNERITDAISAVPELNAKRQAATVRNSLADEGYATDNPYLLEACVERAVIGAHGAGLWAGWQRPEVVGFIHRSVLTETTTKICRPRDGFARPKDDPWWLTNWASSGLHWGCRSCCLALYREREWSSPYPTIPPAPGFGLAPMIFANA